MLKTNLTRRVIFLLSFFTIQICVSQKSNVNKANSAIMNENYQKAVEFIDKAIENVETQNEAKTWYYRGRAYEGLLAFKGKEINDTTIQMMNKVVAAYSKTIELDEKENYKNSAKSKLDGFSNNLVNYLSDSFNEGDYASAIRVLDVLLSFNPKADYYIYAASCAYSLGDYEKSVNHYLNAIDKGNHELSTFDNLFIIAESVQKPLLELQQVLKLSQNLFPQQKSLLHHEVVIREYSDNKDVKIINALYEKILEIDPNDLISLYNLGVFYFNQGASYSDKGAASVELKESFEKAKTYIQKAYEVNPNDKDVTSTLKKIYTELGDKEKAAKL